MVSEIEVWLLTFTKVVCQLRIGVQGFEVAGVYVFKIGVFVCEIAHLGVIIWVAFLCDDVGR